MAGRVRAIRQRTGGNSKAEERCVDAGALCGSCWEQRRRWLWRVELTENGRVSKFNRRRHLVMKGSLRCAVSGWLLSEPGHSCDLIGIKWQRLAHMEDPPKGERELNNTRLCLMSQVKQLFTHVQDKSNQTPAKCEPPLHCLMSCGYGHQQYEKKLRLRWMEGCFLVSLKATQGKHSVCCCADASSHDSLPFSAGSTLLD